MNLHAVMARGPCRRIRDETDDQDHLFRPFRHTPPSRPICIPSPAVTGRPTSRQSHRTQTKAETQVQGQGRAKLPPPSRDMHRFTHSCTMCGSGVSCTDKQTGRHHTFNRDTNFSSLQVTCPSITVVLSLQLQPHEAPKPVTSWSSLGPKA